MSPNQRGKNRRLSSISFTEQEIKEMKEALKITGIDNRSDLVREAVNEWLKKNGYKTPEGKSL